MGMLNCNLMRSGEKANMGYVVRWNI